MDGFFVLADLAGFLLQSWDFVAPFASRQIELFKVTRPPGICQENISN
jgi:hypothetical protein